MSRLPLIRIPSSFHRASISAAVDMQSLSVPVMTEPNQRTDQARSSESPADAAPKTPQGDTPSPANWAPARGKALQTSC